MADVREKDPAFTPSSSKSIKEVRTGYTYFRDNDVILAKVTPCFENGKAGIAKGLLNEIGFGSSEYYVLRPDANKLLSEYLYLLIANDQIKQLGVPTMTGTGGLRRLPRQFIESYEISLPPIKTQREIATQFAEEAEIIAANRKLIKIYEQKIATILADI